MADKKKATKTIFEMDLDEFKVNVEKKTEKETNIDQVKYLLWVVIGMQRKIGRVLLGLDDPSAKQAGANAEKPKAMEE